MKWTNKGHQFDEIAKLFEGVQKIYIYGAGHIGAQICALMGFLGCATTFVDGDPAKQKNGCMGKPVISPQELVTRELDNSLVVVAVHNASASAAVRRMLVSNGLQEGLNLFDGNLFFPFYLSIFALYRFGILYFNRIGVFATERCTLRCKHCAVRIPYIENPKHMPASVMIESFDSLFAQADFVNNFFFSGGEAAMNPETHVALGYFIDNYIDKVNEIHFLTNGYSKVSGELLKLLKHPKVCVHWTNYIDAIEDERIKGAIKRNVNGLISQGVRVLESNYDHWVDFGFRALNGLTDENDLINLYNGCGINDSCLSIQNQSMYACANGRFGLARVNVDEAPFVMPMESDGDERYKHKLLEYSHGFSDTGYLEACKYCYGSQTINKTKLVPGEQL